MSQPCASSDAHLYMQGSRKMPGAAGDQERRLQRLQELLDELMSLTDPRGNRRRTPPSGQLWPDSHHNGPSQEVQCSLHCVRTFMYVH